MLGAQEEIKGGLCSSITLHHRSPLLRSNLNGASFGFPLGMGW
jgi:hypothetical protein